MDQTYLNRKLKQRTWELLDLSKSGDFPGKVIDAFLLILIFLNVITVIFGTVNVFSARHAVALNRFEIFSVAIFSVEYLARIWSCVSQAKYVHPITGRLRFMVKPLSIIDFLAILPFYLSLIPIDLRFIRVIRLVRIFRIGKLERYSSSVLLFCRVFKNKKEELVVTAMVTILLLVLASSFMYFAENEAQPDKFSDIPTAMWWSIATLTTIGYGDVCPITTAGKFLAAIIAIIGIGMFALPTGILGAGFLEEIQRQKSGKTICPHCGKEIE